MKKHSSLYVRCASHSLSSFLHLGVCVCVHVVCALCHATIRSAVCWANPANTTRWARWCRWQSRTLSTLVEEVVVAIPFSDVFELYLSNLQVFALMQFMNCSMQYILTCTFLLTRCTSDTTRGCRALEFNLDCAST